MGFEDHFNQRVVPEWKSKYVNYNVCQFSWIFVIFYPLTAYCMVVFERQYHQWMTNYDTELILLLATSLLLSPLCRSPSCGNGCQRNRVCDSCCAWSERTSPSRRHPSSSILWWPRRGASPNHHFTHPSSSARSLQMCELHCIFDDPSFVTPSLRSCFLLRNSFLVR